MVKLSIIIPVYNVENYISQCLESIFSQSFKDFEIICVNDGSSDNSLGVLQNFKAKDDRIIIIDKNGCIEQANPVCENMTGLSETALKNKKFQEIAYIASKQGNKSSLNNENSGIFGLNKDKNDVLVEDCFIVNTPDSQQVADDAYEYPDFSFHNRFDLMM